MRQAAGTIARQVPAGRPRLRPGVISRPRLVTQLDQALTTGLARVVAAAGFGKTTLVATWLDTLPASTRVAWLSVRDHQSDPSALASDLRAVLLSSGILGPDAGTCATLAELRSALGRRHPDEHAAVIVLDDAHVLADSPASELLAQLIMDLPPGLTYVISCRNDELLPWGLLRGQGTLVELVDADLRFTQAEARELLALTFVVELSSSEADQQWEWAEGWPTGLCLAGLSLHQAQSRAGSEGDTPRRRYVAGYFDEAVLGGCSDDLQQFMLRTCVVPVMDAQLCAHLTGRPDALAVLHQLVDEHLFTTELTGEPPTFRYHSLMARFLRDRLAASDPQLAQELQTRAADWMLDHDRVLEAAELTLRPGADVERMVAVAHRAVGPALSYGYPATVLRWLRALPADRLRADPGLALALGRAALICRESLTAQAMVNHVERLVQADPALRTTGVAAGLLHLRVGLQAVGGHVTRLPEMFGALLDLQARDAGDEILGLLSLTPESTLAFIAVSHLLTGDVESCLATVDEMVTPDALDPPTRYLVLGLGARALALAWSGRQAEAEEALVACESLAGTLPAAAIDTVLFHTAMAWAGPLDRAAESLELVRRIIDTTLLPHIRALPEVAAVQVAIRNGSPSEVNDRLGRARAVVDSLAEPGELAVVLDRLEAAVMRTYPPAPALSDVELRILVALAQGETRSAISHQLHYSVNTVKTHLRSVYRKLGVHDRASAVARAQGWGLLDSTDDGEPAPGPAAAGNGR
jgi:LuxR family maltose regulon positive regulatory protein